MRVLEAIHCRLNGLRNRLSHRRFPPDRVLLLLSHCLQNSDCKVRLKGDLSRCAECGRCKMRDLKALAGRFGVKSFIASGGREAARRARENDCDLVVAVACRRELSEGTAAIFPKRVVGVENSWPHGECTDTDVDVARVEAVLVGLVQDGSACVPPPSARPVG